MVHRLVSVGTVEELAFAGAQAARRHAAGILYEKYRNEIASKIRVTNTAGGAAPQRVNVRRGEWA
ncbi:TPA: hypothetical protein SAY52_000534 [Burkholderia cenocepacia]|uniref:hypothetical protein n=1 Tax=unclassified Burkholderia TaxID=2613784 RepID=UPI00158C84C5|nr:MULTISPECIES: hypothetical protein [unclassified Burkholderia]HEF5869977.1 hypothetical protein [Burkholderia cenocepacia]